MIGDRYVIVGLARARAPWFSEVARWATTGLLAAEFTKAVSVEEVRALLDGGRAASLLLVDGGLPGVDRDLCGEASDRGCAVCVVSDDGNRDWVSTGADAILGSDFAPADLRQVLDRVATPVAPVADGLAPGPERDPRAHRCPLVAVTGAGGTGTSVVALALAQGLSRDPSHRGTTLLADLSLHADQGLLHDADDVVPGLPELLDAHRGAAPDPAEVRRATFVIDGRDHRLLLGLRNHREWTAIRPRALDAALSSLRGAFTVVVADVDDDVEGEASTGSTDVEDRNLLARTTCSDADVVVVTGTSDALGLHHLLRVLRDLGALGVPAERLVPIINRAPRGRAARAEIVRALATYLPQADAGIVSPVLVPERRSIERAVHAAHPLPERFVAPLREAVVARLSAVDVRDEPLADVAPVPVTPGSLGSWTVQGVES